jgi:hypothetical protein
VAEGGTPVPGNLRHSPRSGDRPQLGVKLPSPDCHLRAESGPADTNDLLCQLSLQLPDAFIYPGVKTLAIQAELRDFGVREVL